MYDLSLAQIDDLAQAQERLGIEGFLILVLALALAGAFYLLSRQTSINAQQIQVMREQQKEDIENRKAIERLSEAALKLAMTAERESIKSDRNTEVIEGLSVGVKPIMPMLIEMKAMGLDHKTAIDTHHKVMDTAAKAHNKKLEKLAELVENIEEKTIPQISQELRSIVASIDALKQETTKGLDKILDRVVVLASDVVTMDTKPVETIEAPDSPPAETVEANPT